MEPTRPDTAVPSKPTAPRPQFENYPESMRKRPQWILWRYEVRDGHPTKVPINPKTFRRASSTNPETWTSFEEARAAFEAAPPEAGIAGVGFVFTEDDEYTGIDLDADKVTGELPPECVDALRRFRSYAERSPSGKGVHIIVKGRKPKGRCRRGSVEVYDHGQFFTMTGDRLPDAPHEVEERQAELDAFYAEVLAAKATERAGPVFTGDALLEEDVLPDALVDEAVARFEEYMARPTTGEKVRRLWEGNIEDHGGDDSAADLALCSHLVSCFGVDRALVDAAFRRSKLMRGKWDDPRGERTWGAITLDQVLRNPPGDAPKVPWRTRREEEGRLEAAALEAEPRLTEIEELAKANPQGVLQVLLSRADLKGAVLTTLGARPWRLELLIERLRAAKVPAGRVESVFRTLRIEAERAEAPAPTAEGREHPDSPASLGARLKAQHRFIHVHGRLWLYQGGVYEDEGEAFVRAEVQRALGPRARRDFANEVVYWLSVACRVEAERVDAGETINVRNGLLDWRTLELRPHTPDHLSICQLPVGWNPEAHHVRWDQFLDEVLPDRAERALLEEVFGYCLDPSCRFERAVLLLGTGSNGKTRALEGLEGILGGRNVSHASLQDLAQNRFSLAQLAGKMVNVCGDLPQAALADAGLFKRLVSGEVVSAEHKGKDAFNFRNRAKLVFSANEAPDTRDSSDGFYRRWLFLEFRERFVRREDLKAGEELGGRRPADPQLAEALQTPEGLEYLLKLAVHGLKRLHERGGFEPTPAMRALLADHRGEQDSVRAFVEARCELDPAASEEKARLHAAYALWCRQSDYPPKRPNACFRHLYAAFPGIVEERLQEAGVRTKRVRGVRLAPGSGVP